MNQSVGRSVGPSVRQSVSQSVSQSVRQAASQPVSLSVSQFRTSAVSKIHDIFLFSLRPPTPVFYLVSPVQLKIKLVSLKLV